MKGKLDATKTKERSWCDYCRVCHHHFGGSRLCRFTTNYSAFSGGKANVSRHYSLGSKQSKRRIVSEEGSVTAEFALVLPTILLVLLLSLSALTAQAQRLNLVELSAIGARALARGEDQLVLNEIFSNTEGLRYELVDQNLFICVKLTLDWKVFWLGTVPIVEQQCSRKSGL